jgi:hypothetical protein
MDLLPVEEPFPGSCFEKALPMVAGRTVASDTLRLAQEPLLEDTSAGIAVVEDTFAGIQLAASLGTFD